MTKVFENKVTNAGTAKLALDGSTLDLPMIVGTENEKALDISKLRGKTGYITHDEAYMNTGSTTSAITFLDGEVGHPAVSRLPDRATGRKLRLYRSRRTCCCTANCRPLMSWKIFVISSAVTRCCTKTCGCFTTASLGTPTRWPS